MPQRSDLGGSAIPYGIEGGRGGAGEHGYSRGGKVHQAEAGQVEGYLQKLAGVRKEICGAATSESICRVNPRPRGLREVLWIIGRFPSLLRFPFHSLRRLCPDGSSPGFRRQSSSGQGNWERSVRSGTITGRRCAKQSISSWGRSSVA